MEAFQPQRSPATTLNRHQGVPLMETERPSWNGAASDTTESAKRTKAALRSIVTMGRGERAEAR